MSESSPNFMSLVVNGRVLPDEIDDFVDSWHLGDSAETLAEFLGMSDSEYSLWVRDGAFLEQIITARHFGIPLAKAVNDNIKSQEKIAARADEAWKMKLLRDWIANQSSH